jgi:nucleotide-binding universal stress UspA family protein
MYQDGVNTAPIIRSVLHPTDFSEGSKVAFYHALRAALLTRSELTLLHVASNGFPGWSDFPGIRETLEHWGLLPQNSPKSAVLGIGIEPRKIVARKDDPVSEVVNFVKKNPTDLIVLATHQYKGHERWMHRSVAEPVARETEQMTLFIPGKCKGFVSEDDGSVSLERILIPIADSPRPQPAIEAAARLVTMFNLPKGTFTLMHVGPPESSMPKVRLYEIDGWEWEGEMRNGDVIETIADTAAEIDADLIVMSTDGRNGFLDALRGSHSERVLRRCSTPLLTIPEGSAVASFLG